MMKLLAALMLFTFSVSTAMAADTLVLQNKIGKVVFAHKMHQEMLQQDCTICHGKVKPGKIEGFNKDAAHKLCKGCHEAKSAGPVKCYDCHKK
jgi:hypothetical protein